METITEIVGSGAVSEVEAARWANAGVCYDGLLLMKFLLLANNHVWCCFENSDEIANQAISFGWLEPVDNLDAPKDEQILGFTETGRQVATGNIPFPCQIISEPEQMSLF